VNPRSRGPDPAATPASGRPVAEARQRWRIVFAREEPSARSHRDLAEAWAAALQASGLPLARGEGRPRPPLAFAAPLPVGAIADAELADLTLADRLPVADVRPVVARTMPDELRLVGLHDVWLGAPALAAAVEAADYRVDLAGDVDLPALARACASLLAAPSLVRQRVRGGGTVEYDLRPLLDDVTAAGDPPALRIRTRFHPERGAGRPEEVVAALGDVLGRPVATGVTRRERLILAGER
jgi:radical SAM-linked protein